MKDYKKILEGVVNIINTTEKSDIGFANICSYIGENCPELAESEDERVRKKLISFVENWKNHNPNSPFDDYPIFTSDEDECNKILAWLEKQGEKTKPIEGFDTEFERQISHLIASAIDREHEYNEGYVKWTANALLEYAKRELEKQGEQQPFDYEHINVQQKDFAPKEVIPRYNVGDVLCDKSCTTLNKESQSNFEITDIRNGMYICDKCSFPISQQDEYELVAKRIEQKPWSEEDENVLDDIEEAIINYWGGDTQDILLCWLKSLKQRYTWKPL